MKALLINLPIPELYIEQYRIGRNFPLASGYLASTAMGAGGSWEIELLPRLHNDRAGDALLIDMISRASPDVLGISLYCWNKSRTLHIAGEIRKRLPSTKIIAGGPEVTTGAVDLVNHPAIDAAVAGPGELSFIELLRRVERGSPLQGSPGTLCKRGDSCISIPGEIADPSLIPSPFLDHTLDCRNYRYVLLETTRGCSRRCAYCSERNRSLTAPSCFPLKRICEEIALLKEQHVQGIYFIDSAFNRYRNYHDLCRFIQGANAGRSMASYVSFLADEADSSQVASLDASFVVDAGLQSLSPEVRRRISRPFSIPKFLSFMKLLAAKGIERKAHVILGLPGETSASLKHMAAFLESEREAIPRIVIFILQLLRDSVLFREREKYGLLCQDEPPYYVLGSDSLSFAGLREAITAYNEKFGDPGWHRAPPSWTRTSWSSHSRPAETASDAWQEGETWRYPISKILVDLNKYHDHPMDMRQIRKIAGLLSNSVTFWCENVAASHSDMLCDILASLSRENPYGVWNIVIEPAGQCPPSLFSAIRDAIHYLPNYLDYASVFLQDDPECPYLRASSRIFVLLDPLTSRIDWAEEVNRLFPVFWKLAIRQETPLPSPDDLTFHLDCGEGLVVHFAEDCAPSKIIDCLRILRPFAGASKVAFTDFVIQQEWEYDGALADMTHISDMEDCILTLEPRGFHRDLLTRKRVATDYIAWIKGKCEAAR
jgi:hypothetical protein